MLYKDYSTEDEKTPYKRKRELNCKRFLVKGDKWQSLNITLVRKTKCTLTKIANCKHRMNLDNDVVHPIQEFFTYMETSPLPVKG
jgi:hypothetical protein